MKSVFSKDCNNCIPNYANALSILDDDEDDDDFVEQNSPGKKDGCFLFAIVPVICVFVYMLI